MHLEMLMMSALQFDCAQRRSFSRARFCADSRHRRDRSCSGGLLRVLLVCMRRRVTVVAAVNSRRTLRCGSSRICCRAAGADRSRRDGGREFVDVVVACEDETFVVNVAVCDERQADEIERVAHEATFYDRVERCVTRNTNAIKPPLKCVVCVLKYSFKQHAHTYQTRLGERLTSRSHGFKFSSMSTSKPNNSKHVRGCMLSLREDAATRRWIERSVLITRSSIFAINTENRSIVTCLASFIVCARLQSTSTPPLLISRNKAPNVHLWPIDSESVSVFLEKITKVTNRSN